MSSLPPIDTEPPALQPRLRDEAEQHAIEAELDAVHEQLGVRRGHALQEAMRPELRVPYENLMSAATSAVGAGPNTSQSASMTAGTSAAREPPMQPSNEIPQLLALPAPEDVSSSVTLDVSTGQPVVIDRLGPVVVNVDGTLSRIANWDEMTERERALTQRRISKRNVERLKEFRDQGELNSDVVSALGE
mmetsp:Transcript_9633/g.13744  ORF Transcript_9633/g.13744 Transcript_9633/m.13744 type:complete len:190 (+) Transcript_9633:3-572(+)